MKEILKIIIIVFSCISAFGQDENLSQTKYQFAQKIFEKEYSKQTFEKFTGAIIVENENTIKFNEKTLTFIDNIKDEYKQIFKNGLFYPNIITGNYVAEIKTKEELEKMTPSEKVFYNMTRIDSLSIANFGELKLLNPNYKTKRFRIWVFKKGMMNPTEWYFELQNKKATKRTKLNDFIKNAELTYCRKGTIII